MEILSNLIIVLLVLIVAAGTGYFFLSNKLPSPKKENELLLEKIFDDAPVILILVDADSNVVKINQYGRNLGLSEMSINQNRQIGNVIRCVNASKHELGCGHSSECSSCPIRSSIRSSISRKKNHSKISASIKVAPDGCTIHLDVLISTSYFEIKSKPLLLLVFEDITNLKMTETALVESESRYRQITRTISDYIFRINLLKDGRLETTHNFECFQFLGYTLPEFEKYPNLWLDMIHADDREHVIQFIRTNSFGTEHPSIEYRIIRKDGSEIWVYNTLVALKGKRGIEGYDSILRNITTRKRNEENMANQNRLLNTMLESLPIGIFMVSAPEGRPLLANSLAKHLLGKGILPGTSAANMSQIYRAYVAGTNQLYPAEKTPIIMGMYGQTARIDDLEIELNDGSRRLLEIMGSPVYDNHNKIWASLVGFYDITERRNTQVALRESEEKLSLIFEYSHVGISLTDTNGHIQYMNPAFCQLLCLQPDQISNNNFQLFSSSENDSVSELFDQLKNGLISKLNIEQKFTRNEGSDLWVQMQVSCFRNSKGELANFITVAEDITDRKIALDQLCESEEKFRNIFNNSNDGILITDFEGRVLDANQISLDRIGLTLDQLRKISIIDVISQADRAEARAQYQNLIANKNAVFQSDYISPKGERFYIEINGRAINYLGREAALLVSRDITERKILQKKILNAIIESEEKERKSFAQELHDGLGPILSTIKLYLQWIENPEAKSNKSELIREALDTVEEAIVGVKEISNKLSPNVLSKYGFEIALNSFVKKIANTKQIQFDLSINLLERLRADLETMLYRICVEAINNTLKYAEAKTISIKIETNNNILSLSYRDNGKGFDVPEVMSRGNGHGLFNMQNRVETYGGLYNLSSFPGYGMEISVRIPV